VTRNRDAVEKVAIDGFPCVPFCRASNYKPSSSPRSLETPDYSEKQSHYQTRKTASAQLGPRLNLCKTTLVCSFELARKLSQSSESRGFLDPWQLGSHHRSSVSSLRHPLQEPQTPDREPTCIFELLGKGLFGYMQVEDARLRYEGLGSKPDRKGPPFKFSARLLCADCWKVRRAAKISSTNHLHVWVAPKTNSDQLCLVTPFPGPFMIHILDLLLWEMALFGSFFCASPSREGSEGSLGGWRTHHASTSCLPNALNSCPSRSRIYHALRIFFCVR
jgi:hypothetical protein